METIIIILALIFIALVIVPVCVNLCKQQIWDFVKDEIEKDAKYERMVKDMLKGKQKHGSNFRN